MDAQSGLLTQRFKQSFASDVRLRGKDYFLDGAVAIVKRTGETASAYVQGSRRYQVRLAWNAGEMSAACSCPYSSRYGLCKHIWATLLELDAPGNLEEDEDDEGDFEEVDDEYLDAPQAPAIRRQGRAKPHRPPAWQEALDSLASAASFSDRGPAWPAGDQLLYVVNLQETLTSEAMVLETMCRRLKRNSTSAWTMAKPRSLSPEIVPVLPTAEDRTIAARLLGGQAGGYYYSSSYGYSSFRLLPQLRDELLPLLCRTGRCLARAGRGGAIAPLAFDDGGAYDFCLAVRRQAGAKQYTVEGELRRGDRRVPLSQPALLLAGGWVFLDGQVAPLNDHGAFQWIALLRRQGPLEVPSKEGEQLLERLLQMPALPAMDLPPELQYRQVSVAMAPCLRLRAPKSFEGQALVATLEFDYAGLRAKEGDRPCGFFDAGSRTLTARDAAAEAHAVQRLEALGASRGGYDEHRRLAPNRLPRVVAELMGEGWRVEAEGKLYRSAGSVRMSVATGLDWFELHGSADFDGQSVPLPRLLAAMHKGESFVTLDDGSMGVLPEEWLRKYGMLSGMGETEGDHLRLSRSQACVLDALLAAQPQASCDEAFDRLRKELRRFEAIEPVPPPESFRGQLRPYQCEGLGWLHFLRKFGFGGCLADDMGLGKTVQILALLEHRRLGPHDEGGRRPSLIVVPRSVLFNWRQEAEKFTPHLRILDHCGIDRVKDSLDHLADYDAVLTTYGTLRRDVTALKDIAFDYVVLDESQAIKNAATASAKAVRLLQARHRLCLSGTPVENHLGELWSQFEFLNPGMLGRASVLNLASGDSQDDDATRQLLARALRPFILRRTKSQVAKDLPERTEQTLYCELQGPQRQMYDELRDHYRKALLAKVESDGIGKSKIQILEALLRLRQAACHVGLIDKARTADPSAKLEALLPQLQEVLAEGHKALVFSQFTSLLRILRDRLEEQKVDYEYLDGRTRDRQAPVNRFQQDPACGLFLISLKAGGLGLNLTAADYVFLLDPWWNPAVEAQAVDRAHRIGQTRQVFAYRLIARNTVEERVLELQQKKRDLADAIINADNSLIRTLSREDLQLLLQ